MTVQTIYVVTVNGKPVYSHTQRSEADIEADLQGGIVTPVYLYSGVKK